MKTKKSFVMNTKTLATLGGETAHERMLHRLHSVVLVMLGVSAKEVAKAFGDSPRAVAYWVTQYKAKGVAGLEGKTSPGRTPRLTESQTKRLRSAMKREEKTGRRADGSWLQLQIEKSFGIPYTERQCRRILKQLRQ